MGPEPSTDLNQPLGDVITLPFAFGALALLMLAVAALAEIVAKMAAFPHSTIKREEEEPRWSLVLNVQRCSWASPGMTTAVQNASFEIRVRAADYVSKADIAFYFEVVWLLPSSSSK